MIELHYAGVIANWDGKQVPAEGSIPAARKNGGRKWTERLMSTEPQTMIKTLEIRLKPSVGLEPTTPSLP
jgi:hypothetical protein